MNAKKTLMTGVVKWKLIKFLYKIMTKGVTNRLLLTLDKVFSTELSAAVLNRTIYNIPFAIRDFIEYSDKKKILVYILNFDQEKVFDKDNQNYTLKCL